MKKKLISLLLVSAMAAATAGCGSSVPANSVNSRDDLPGKKIGVQPVSYTHLTLPTKLEV